MEKLTREQADYLIKLSKDNYWKNWEDPEDWFCDVINKFIDNTNDSMCGCDDYESFGASRMKSYET